MSDLAVGSLSAGRATSIQENIAVFLGAVGPFIRRLTWSKALLLTSKQFVILPLARDERG
jgi:hypothetical protein